MRQIINATQIDQWFISTRRDAQELLPHLVRKLIVETVSFEALKTIRIPVEDQIGCPGYDGVVETTAEHPYVPMGLSVWEWGTGNPLEKFKEDYSKRTKKPKGVDPPTTTFAFVTPHAWRNVKKNESLLQERQAKTKWKGIQILDKNDLEFWLELAPGAAQWLARQMGHPVEGMRDLEMFKKEELDARYGINILDELLIGGRNDSVTALHGWIDSDSMVIRIEGESVEEASAFIAAAIDTLSDERDQKEKVISRFLFAHKPEVIDFLASLKTTHFIVALTSEVRNRAMAIGSPTLRIIVPKTRAVGDVVQKEASLKLDPVRRNSCEQALSNMGLPLWRAQRIAQESKGSLTAIFWMIDEEHDISLPWTIGAGAMELVPLVLAGQWSDNNEKDHGALEKLAGHNYEEIKRAIYKWTNKPKDPLILRGSTWDWLGWDYAWSRLAPYIDRKRMDCFREVVKEVLGAFDPRLELEADKRWAAEIYNKKHPFSAALRSGLIGSIVQFALQSDRLTGTNGQSLANSLVRELLDGQNFPRKTMWVSVASWLPDLAEAAPDSFLDDLDKFLDDNEAIAAIFEEGGMFGWSPHTYLLWALERLAWSKDFLTRVTLELGALAAVDPGGQLSNRPAHSLTEIFLPWHPQTVASPQERLDAIEELYNRQPDVAWKLAVSLLPQSSGIATSTAEPRWRPWKPDKERQVMLREYWGFIGALIERMIKWAGNSGLRWSEFVKSYDDLIRPHPELANRILSSLQQLDHEDFVEADRTALTESLRGTISHHKQFPEADWAMSKEQLGSLEELYNKFQPHNIINQYSWLFTSWPNLPIDRELDYEQQMKLVQEEREKAVKTIYEAEGAEALLSLAEKVECPNEIGYAMANLDINDRIEADLLRRILSIETTAEGFPSHLRMGWGYINGCYRRHGDSWIDRVLKMEGVSWDANRYANLALGLPAEGSTWDRLAEWGKDAEKHYWLRTTIHYLQEPERDAERAIKQLYNAGRPYRALDLTGMCIRRVKREGGETEALPISSELIIKVLEEAPRHSIEEEWYPPVLQGISYGVERLLDILEKIGIEESVLAGLEWKWMAVLEYSKRGLKALQNALSTSPGLFVDVLKLIYRAKGEEPSEVSEDHKARAAQGYRLLQNWEKIPGIVTYEGQVSEKEAEGDITFNKGKVDQNKLFEWVQEARKLAEECNRLTVCDIRIGNVLAYAPMDPDGQWPCVAVCNLVEEIASPELEEGLETGVRNKRGAHWRARGGEQERKLAQKFHSYGERVRSKWPRTAGLLNRIAEDYEKEARWQDERDLIEEFE
jgi:hypothetical protein